MGGHPRRTGQVFWIEKEGSRSHPDLSICSRPVVLSGPLGFTGPGQPPSTLHVAWEAI